MKYLINYAWEGNWWQCGLSIIALYSIIQCGLYLLLTFIQILKDK